MPDGSGDNVTSLKHGLKFDDKKLRYDLLPIDALRELVYIYTIGAAKILSLHKKSILICIG